MNISQERRRNRSELTHPALQLQLGHVRDEFDFEEVILATGEGLKVAWAGDDVQADVLAAASPELDQTSQHAALMEAIGPHLSSLDGREIVVRRFEIDEVPLYLCVVARQQSDVREAMSRMQDGVRRIFSTTVANPV